MKTIKTSANNEDDTTANQLIKEILLVIDANGQTRVQVGLPEGLDASSQEINSDQLPALRDRLIVAADLKIDDTNIFNEILQNGIDPFIGNVADEDQVILRIFTFSKIDTVETEDTETEDTETENTETDQPPQPTHQTIIINGASGTGENDPNFPLRQEALVLDTRDLLPGTELQLNNIEFAIVIGGGRITGGDGNNFVVGNETDQVFVLGDGNDILRGGDGNDTIGSQSGNDQIFGDNGDDYLVGGIGDDLLNGGNGNDLLQGGTSFAGIVTFGLDNSDSIVSTYLPIDPALGTSVTTNWFSGNKRITNDERVAFVYRDIDQLEAIATLYQSILHRLPTTEEMNQLSASNLSATQLSELAFSYYSTIINTTQNQSDESLSADLITHVWGAEFYNTFWANWAEGFLNDGGTREEMLLFMATHENLTNRLLDANGNSQLSQDLVIDELGITSENGNDILNGGQGNDILIDGFGHNRFDGGDGFDSVQLVETLNIHQISLNDRGFITVVRNDAKAVNTLIDIEEISFSDQVLTVDFLNLDKQTLKHVAGVTHLMDDTTPIWTHLNQFAQAAITLTEFTQQLMQTDGYQRNWESLSNQAFITQISETAFGEALTGDNLDFWTDQLDQNLVDRGELFVTVAGINTYQEMIFDGNGLALF